MGNVEPKVLMRSQKPHTHTHIYIWSWGRLTKLCNVIQGLTKVKGEDRLTVLSLQIMKSVDGNRLFV